MFLYRVYIALLICLVGALRSQDLMINGTVSDHQNHLPIENVSIRIYNLPLTAKSDDAGKFQLTVPKRQIYKIVFSHLAYQSFIKELRLNGKDTLRIVIELTQKPAQLDSVTVLSHHKPETLVAKTNYSVFDFDFYEDKLLLLTSEGSMNKTQVRLSDYEGKIYATYAVPKQAGEAKHFFHDYEGYTDLICKDSVFRIDLMNNELMILPVSQKDFYRYVKPVADTLNKNYYYSDAWDQYPLFNYYFLKKNDSASHLLRTIQNAQLMDLYNFEYYFLPPNLQLEARRIEQHQKIDRHIAAALMSGFTQSLFYEPLYAPLLILNDTICIFNHYNDMLYHYNRENQLIDSVRISYHHPKNWKEWKKQLFVDEIENKVYALFSKDGHHYLKNINHQTGKESSAYKLQYNSAEKIKIKDGFVYYVYRPFGSTQEKFLYRERIE